MLREIFHPCVPALVACSNIAPETPGLYGSPGFSERYHATCVMSGETQGRILRRNVRRDGAKCLR